MSCFQGKTFAISGTLSMKRDDFISLIIKNGGKVSSNGPTKDTDFLVTTEKEVQFPTQKVHKATGLGIPFVSEEFVVESVGAGKILDFEEYGVGKAKVSSSEEKDDSKETSVKKDKPATKKRGVKANDEEEKEEEAPKKRKSTRKSESEGSEIFSGITICVSGTLSVGRVEFTKLLTENGALISSSVTKATDYLVSTEDEVAKGTTKTEKASANGIPIVSEQFIHDSIERKSIQDPRDYLLGSDESDEEAEVAAKEEKPVQKEKAIQKKAAPATSKQTNKKESASSASGAGVFAGITFCISGTLTVSRADISKKLTENGASISSTVTKATNFLVTTEEEFAEGTIKTNKATSCGIPIVNESFVWDSVNRNALQNKNEYLIGE